MTGDGEAGVLVTGHDMSRYWRLVSNEGGLITGTWWVTRADRRGEQHVKPIDVVMWSAGRNSGLTLHSEDFTAFVRDGHVEPISVRARHSHVEAEANARLDEIAAAVLAVAAAPEWPEEPTSTPPGETTATDEAARCWRTRRVGAPTNTASTRPASPTPTASAPRRASPSGRGGCAPTSNNPSPTGGLTDGRALMRLEGVVVMAAEEILAKHVFMEATGGYIECSCGWPTKEQYEAGEYEVVHVIDELVANGHLIYRERADRIERGEHVTHE